MARQPHDKLRRYPLPGITHRATRSSSDRVRQDTAAYHCSTHITAHSYLHDCSTLSVHVRVLRYMFGKGIYLADCSSKSANYCFTTSSNSTGCMLLCEAALGKMNELLSAQYMEKAPKGFDSTKGCGSSQPDPAQAVTLTDGVVVPSGPIVRSNVAGSGLLYNEYIVYDISQVHIRYLLKLNFKYKRNQW